MNPPSPDGFAGDNRDRLFAQFAKIGGALSSPVRLRMLSLLSHKERNVEELAELTQQSLASASAHLKVLRAAYLVSTEKRGRNVFVQLADQDALHLWLVFREVGSRLLPEARETIENHFNDRESIASLTPRGLAKELKSGSQITLIDLRPANEFAFGHLPTSRNFPFSDLSKRSGELRQIPSNHPIYAYCRGPYCVMALNGVQKLRAMGLPALRLPFSVPEWMDEHLKIERPKSG